MKRHGSGSAWWLLMWVVLGVGVGGANAQVIETVAGMGAAGFAGDGGDARQAMLDGPRALALRPDTGDLFLVDYSNNRIRRVDARGVIGTVAGSGEINPLQEGSALRSPFIQLHGVAWSAADGKLYLAESGGLLAVDAAGTLKAVLLDRAVPVLAGEAGRSGVLFSDFLRVQRWEADGTVRTLAGSDEPGDEGDGGAAAAARFQFVTALAQDRLGRIWVADAESRRVRRFLPGGGIETVAGGSLHPEALAKPAHIAVDVAGNLYIADSFRLQVYRVAAVDGAMDVFAGSGLEESRGDGGPAKEASFAALNGIAVNCGGVYVSDAERVRRIAVREPLIALQGVRNAETGEPGLRPGRRFAIEGCQLAEGVARAEQGQRGLAGAELLVDGVPVPLLTASPERLEAMVPQNWPLGTVTIEVRVGSKIVKTTAEVLGPAPM
ncbi:MAG: hypothetical protein JNK87_00795 [Bryobacterales bacterium]|nr:hypothetical protein [Bryobacterales bacterium]